MSFLTDLKSWTSGGKTVATDAMALRQDVKDIQDILNPQPPATATKPKSWWASSTDFAGVAVPNILMLVSGVALVGILIFKRK